MASWKVTLQVIAGAVRVLATDQTGNDVLKAHLTEYPDHPRALLTVLEGLALWCGQPLCVAISADIPVSHSLGLGSFTDEEGRWPEESALVQFVFVGPARGGRRLKGLGDFSRLRRLGLVR